MLSNNDTIRVRVRLMACIALLFFPALIARLAFVQYNRHEELLAKARDQYTFTGKSMGKRGEIRDVNGSVFVSNIPCENIIADPSAIAEDAQRRKLPPEQRDILQRKLAMIFSSQLGIDYREVYRKLMRSSRIVHTPEGRDEVRPVRYAMIDRGVPHDKAAKLKQIIRAGRFKGIVFQEDYARYYPKGRMLSNILGFGNMRNDRLDPQLGLEKFFNRSITGTAGSSVAERGRDGRILSYGDNHVAMARDGAHIYLTISEPVQAIMEEELDAAFERVKPKAIYAVMADPATGSILAIAQRPTFDPNDRRHVSPEAWRTRMLEDGYEPGSIMKPLTVSGALDNGVVRPDTRFDVEHGRWMYLRRMMRDTGDYGHPTVAQIIQHSSNIGTAKIALKMGDKMLDRTLRGFGLGSKTGLPLPHEISGIFPTYRRWDGLTGTRVAIGYSILVSPVQMVRAYCALANGGYLRKLRLIDRAEFPDGRTYKSQIAPPVAIFKRPETWGEIIPMMVSVTEPGGTATGGSVPGFKVAGKTGTSQKRINGVYTPGKYFASFCGFVPAEKAAFVLLVTVDEPTVGSGYGGRAAAPVFRAIAERTLRYMNIPPTHPVPVQEAAKPSRKP